MKKVILLALLMPFPAFGQIIENFESQSLANWIQSTQGCWLADTSHSLSGRYSLHHVFDNPDEGIDRIGIRTSNLHPLEGITRWSFLVHYGYDPSSSNNWSVFLMSDSSPAEMSAGGETKGYAIGVNLAGSDDSLRLWKVDGDLLSMVVNCRINWQTGIGISSTVKIAVERMVGGDWTVTVSHPDGGIISTGSGNDSELFDPEWFGIYYKYSSTKDQLLWIDDILIDGLFYADIYAPVITGCEAYGKNSVLVSLDEEPVAAMMVPDNFSLNNPENKAVSVTRENTLKYRIQFQNEFVNREESVLMIKELCDLEGNCELNTVWKFTASWAGAGDIMITEVMADPSPSVSLPEMEFIEITNRTEFPISLAGWKLSTESQSYPLPGITIPQSGILILCQIADTSAFRKYGSTAGMKTFPSLTDGGRILLYFRQLRKFYSWH